MKRNRIYKVLAVSLGALLLVTSVWSSRGSSLEATGTRPATVVDVDFGIGGGMGNGSIVATSDGQILVTGQEEYGVFGDGGAQNDLHTGFTAIDTSFLDSPVKDIVSGMMRTTLLTESGRVYYTGGYDVDYNYILTYQAVDPALFGNSPVTKIFRNVFFEILQTADGKLYSSPRAWANGDYIPQEVPLPNDGSGLVTPVQTMAGMSGSYLYLLDSVGRVWLADNWYSFVDDPITNPINWVLTTTPEPVTIKSMVMIREAFFLTTDGRVMFASYFDDPVLGNINTPSPDVLEFTSISDVTEFLPYYAPVVHNDMPNIRKSDGHIYVGATLLDAYGANTGLSSTDYVDMSIYISGIEQARILTIGVYPSWFLDNLSSGLYLIGDQLHSINGDVVASNGVLTQEGSPLPPLTTAAATLPPVEYVLDPVTPTFEGTGQNPTAAFLGPFQQGSIPVQANWQIKNSQGNVVAQGTIPESTALAAGQGVRLDIAALQLPQGDYSLSFFRETTPDHTGSYMRSAGTATANFTIRLAGGAVTVRFLDESARELAPAQVINGLQGETFSTLPQSIPNYTLITTPSNASGVFTADPQTVDYIYRATYTGAPVTVRHLDAAGEAVGEDQVLMGNLGDPFKAEPLSRPGLYILEFPANAQGTFTDSPQTVTFVYTPNARTKVVVKFQNEQGKDIAEAQTLEGFPGTPFKTEPKKISGYTLLKTPANASGTFTSVTQEVIYIYRKSDLPKTGEKETLMGVGGWALLTLAGTTIVVRKKRNRQV